MKVDLDFATVTRDFWILVRRPKGANPERSMFGSRAPAAAAASERSRAAGRASPRPGPPSGAAPGEPLQARSAACSGRREGGPGAPATREARRPLPLPGPSVLPALSGAQRRSAAPGSPPPPGTRPYPGQEPHRAWGDQAPEQAGDPLVQRGSRSAARSPSPGGGKQQVGRSGRRESSRDGAATAAGAAPPPAAAVPAKSFTCRRSQVFPRPPLAVAGLPGGRGWGPQLCAGSGAPSAPAQPGDPRAPPGRPAAGEDAAGGGVPAGGGADKGARWTGRRRPSRAGTGRRSARPAPRRPASPPPGAPRLCSRPLGRTRRRPHLCSVSHPARAADDSCLSLVRERSPALYGLIARAMAHFFLATSRHRAPSGRRSRS
ncbi:translation initiation factor IF-2-like [Psammomys obesus]|uniref:translation initiation factor IF-2-like n=1 Tax=Psammomys obesus TaxID=48139 RepID=UPI0024534BB2|nr:translation initiation factor IF-2-like [Psammomys obesus]